MKGAKTIDPEFFMPSGVFVKFFQALVRVVPINLLNLFWNDDEIADDQHVQPGFEESLDAFLWRAHDWLSADVEGRV